MSSKFVLQQEDGTVAGGNARGEYAIDLGLSRTFAYQVASGKESIAIGNLVTAAGTNRGIAIGYNVQARTSGIAIGDSSSATPDYAIAIGRNNNILDNAGVAIGTNVTAHGRSVALGNNNSATHYDCFVAGQGNSTSSQYSTVSGGQSNTASTGTHATVVGGASNTASGAYSVAGGYNNVASGEQSIALGRISRATGPFSFAACQGIASHSWAVALGYGTASGMQSAVIAADGAVASAKASLATGKSYAYMYGMVSMANDVFPYGTGSTQNWFVNTSNSGLNNPSTTLNFTSGSTAQLGQQYNGGAGMKPLTTNAVWNVMARWSAIVTNISGTATGVSVGDVIVGNDTFFYKQVSGTASISTPTSVSSDSDASMSTATMTYSTTLNQGLVSTFTAPTFAGGGTLTIQVMTNYYVVEIQL